MRRGGRGRRGVAAALLILAAAGCAARAAPNPSPAVADAQTAVRVKTALVNDPALGTLPIGVRAQAGVVTLHGTVPSSCRSFGVRSCGMR